MGSMGTVSETGFGWLTPVLSYLMACVGGALGLRATVRAVHASSARSRRNWLLSAVVGIGVLLVTRGQGRPLSLLAGGLATGVGVAAMHYLGMGAVHMNGTVSYAPWEVG